MFKPRNLFFHVPTVIVIATTTVIRTSCQPIIIVLFNFSLQGFTKPAGCFSAKIWVFEPQ